MNVKRTITSLIGFSGLVAFVLLAPSSAQAHCDGMDGPVVVAAQKAIETRNLNLVLIWVQKADEPEIRTAFQKTLAVRKLSPEARGLADQYFFETLVRIHRAGEGEPYTGLKPAGRDLGPAIPAADKAIGSGSLEPLMKFIPAIALAEIRERFNTLIARKNYNENDVEAGRRYVAAYVEFIHQVEGLYESAEASAHDQPRATKPATHSDVQPTAAHHEPAHHEMKGGHDMEFKIPQSLQTEHQELHSELAKATTAGGRVGEAAKEVARVLHPHFVKEEEYAMPPLGLLPVLAEGKVTPDMASALVMTDKLKAELPEMLKEHKAIVAALELLVNAAKAENKPEYVRFGEKLMLHAQTEEEVLYPASILIGEYLRFTLKK